nr:MAG TPA: Type I restriction enzyme [Caudoviricetes sp.]
MTSIIGNVVPVATNRSCVDWFWCINKSLAQYDAQGSAAWGETDWNGIKADVDRLIDNDKNLQAYQNGVLANENLSKPQRETISQYIATRKTLQAFDLFAKVGNEKSKPNEFDIRYNDAYIAGTQVKSPDQMAQMRESLDASRNTLSNLLGIKPEQVDALFADTNKSLGQIYEELTQQFVDNEKANLPNGQSVNTTNIEPIKHAIDHYCTALSMQRGVSESLITSQLEAVQKLDAKVDAATNKDSGMIERATDDMGRECYVISGNADSSNNTNMVVVRYTEDGRVASLSPKQVTIIQQTDAHELKQKNADLVDLNYEGILNSIVNGKTLPEPNDQVVLYDGKSRGVATIEGIKYEESTKDDTRGVAAQPKSVVVKTEDGRIIELPIDTYRQWVRDGFKHDTEVYVHGTESDNSENTNKPTEGTENATEALTLAEGLRVSINGNEYTIGKVDDSRVELIDENGKDFHWTRSALDKKLKSGDAEILASNEENAQQKPELHYGDEVELNDPDNGENIRGKVNSRDASDEVEIVTDDGRVLRYSKRELDNVIQNVYNNGEHIWSKDENKTEEASNETDTEQEPQPIGKGMFGNIYNQFKGKAKEAINFLKKLGSGEAVAALHHKEVGDISLVWGNDKAGLKKILRKHPEVVDNLQGILDGMHVVQSSENRIILESDTHKAVVSREFDGTPREQWLLTAYEKKNASGGSIDIVPEPTEGKQNGTAPLQDILSADKVTEQSATSQAEAPQNEPMPMHTVGKGKNAVQTEDWLATTPKRGFDYIFGGESGLDADEGREFVNNKLAEAQKNLDKVKNGKPKMGTSIAAYKEAKEAYTTRVEDAQKAVDYWQSVKAEHDKVLLAERHARDEKDKALHEQAVAEEQQRMQDDARKATEQAELGSNAVAPTIRDKWNAAKKENGDADEITLPNGEVVKGHYVLTESGAASASHQATNGFAETEGFPIDENGQSVNDRDYKRDQEAQQVTRSMATDYDQRALQSPVVVSQEGVVLSGNGRTMAGELAAQDGTDTKYVDYLHSHANKFGFTPEQVNGFKHPRVVFVPNEAMPYNADTFAKFNQREQKSQNNTEMAVKMGKVVNDALFGRIMDMVSKYDTLGEFYADDNATYAVVKQLAEADIIPQTEMAHLFDGGKLSEAGQSMIEGVMIGKVFQANPDAVRQITEVKSMRQAVMTALQDIVQNNRLGGGYNLSNELAEAVNLVYRARKAGYKLGQHVSYFAHQGNLFEYDEGATVADFNNMAVMMLADVLNDGRSTQLKKVIAFYNEQATDAAQGIGDMFVGGVKSKTEIINEVNKALNNGREYNTTATSLADGQGQRNQSSKQSNDVGTSDTDGKPTNDTSAVTAETDVESGATEGEKSSATGDVVPSGEGDSPLSEKIATASAEVNTEPTEAQKEAGNYKKGHVKVGTFDITIEQPQGSVRKGTDADGKQWESKMNNTYGYIRGAVGVDGDHIDVFLSNDIDGWNGRNVFVVDQYNPDGSFDEHKVMLGFNDADEAKSDYLANYEKGWEDGRRIDVTAVNLEDFEKWIESSKRKTKPFGEYAGVKKETVAADEMGTQKYSALPEDLRQQKADGKSAQLPTREETILRDAVIDHMKESGLDVLGTEEGQQVLDMANGRYVRLSAKQKRALETVTMADKSTNKATAISSADGAKVQNNLEKLAESYNNRSNRVKGFITDLSQALNLEQHEASHYGTFETKDGKLVTIRVSNHNARVSFFDENGEEDGISIVISNHKNKGVLNDGNAHIVEYFYPKQSLQKSENKPLADIINCVSTALNSGKFEDTTGLAQRQEVNGETIREHRVYHGSGADFDHFDHSHMGEGEGAQAYGWGTYVTEVEGIGRTYAEQNPRVAEDNEYERENANEEIASKTLARFGNIDCEFGVIYDGAGSFEDFTIPRDKKVLEQFKDYFKSHEEEFQSFSDVDDFNLDDEDDREQFAQDVESSMMDYAESIAHDYDMYWNDELRMLYTVEIPDEKGKNYLDWNGHPAESLLKDVGSFLESNGFERVQDSPARYEKGKSTVVLNPNATGADLYAELQESLGSDKKASQTLAELGYIGIKYPADNMRGGREDGAKNYVIFNENDAKITDHVRFFKTKNGEAYGFTIGGKIYIDPKVATSETPVHEYAHLWATALKANNAKEWQNVVGLMKGTSVWEEVKKLYPELKSDDEIADEVLATYSGRRGAERLRKEMDDIAKSNGNVFDKATAMSALHRVKQAIEKFWHAVADFLHIHYISAEQVADQVMKDLLNGVDPRKFGDTKNVKEIDNVRYSLKDGSEHLERGKGENGNGDKTLAGVHNITEDKLRKALKLGGLANPSVAVIDTEKQGHSGYGEISLILPSQMVAKRTGRNAGTFFGDAWTPTYPQVERIFGKGGGRKGNEGYRVCS